MDTQQLGRIHTMLAKKAGVGKEGAVFSHILVIHAHQTGFPVKKQAAIDAYRTRLRNLFDFCAGNVVILFG